MKEKHHLDVSDPAAPKPRNCPFTGVAVPSGWLSQRTGTPEFVMEVRECNAECALFDAATGRNCLERAFAKLDEVARHRAAYDPDIDAARDLDEQVELIRPKGKCKNCGEVGPVYWNEGNEGWYCKEGCAVVAGKKAGAS